MKKIRKWDKLEHFHARLRKSQVDFLNLQALAIKMQRDKKRGVQREYITANSILRASIMSYMVLAPIGAFEHSRLDLRNILTEEELMKRVLKASLRNPLTEQEMEQAAKKYLRGIHRKLKIKGKT